MDAHRTQRDEYFVGYTFGVSWNSGKSMNISLSPRLEQLVRKKVESGIYDSVKQVIEEALFLLEESDLARSMRRERLLEEVAIGVNQADNRQLMDSIEVFRSLHRKPISSGE